MTQLFDKKLAIEIRAALLEQASALKLQRDGILKTVAALERAFKIGKQKETGDGETQDPP